MRRFKIRVLSFFGLLVLVSNGSAFAADKPKITWLISDQAPVFIVDGPDKGRGHMDKALGLIQKALPEFDHEILVANPQRSALLLKPGGLYLGVGFVKTPEREKALLFSKAIAVGLPPKLLIRQPELARFQPFIDRSGAIDVSALLASRSAILGVTAGRSYGANLDAILEKYKNDPNVFSRQSGSKITDSLVQMLLENRIEATFSYGTELKYSVRDDKIASRVRAIPITQAKSMVSIHIVAPTDAWGRQTIDRVNQVLSKIRNTDEYLNAISYWDDDDFKSRKINFLKGLD